jgi:hypothetical protein
MRGGANGGSIFDYQQDSDTWTITDADIRDADWRPMRPDEASLESGEIGSIDYTLDYYGDQEPYYWRYNEEAEQASGGKVDGVNP